MKYLAGLETVTERSDWCPAGWMGEKGFKNIFFDMMYYTPSVFMERRGLVSIFLFATLESLGKKTGLEALISAGLPRMVPSFDVVARCCVLNSLARNWSYSKCDGSILVGFRKRKFPYWFATVLTKIFLQKEIRYRLCPLGIISLDIKTAMELPRKMKWVF